MLKSGKVTVSCELFPPKEGSELAGAEDTVRRMAALKPDYMSVTFRAGGGTAENSVRVASYVQKYGVPALAHLTCVSSTRDDVGRLLDRFRENRVENVLALRGDVPRGSGFPSPGQYRYAYELIREIKSRGDFCIGAACYPEGHVECEHSEDDLRYLKQKVECGCDFLTTQMFFDNNVYYNFLYRILSKGIDVPVTAGIMPVTNSRQIRRICSLSGTVLPARFRAIVDRFADRPEAMMQAGIAYATEQIIDLVSNGVKSVHIYAMNRPDVAGKILQNISSVVEA